MADLFLKALMAHLIGDWFLQNHWMAEHKVKPLHPAAWIHMAIHLVLLMLVFPLWLAVAVGGIHYLIDLRLPLIAWRSWMKQTAFGPTALHVAIWQDQATHILVLYAAARLIGG
jgi:hypothetical protein